MEKQREGINLGVLPEGCIVNILSFTSPPDACRFSLVSPSFRSAADSDAVWKGFLPSDYVSMVSESDDRSDLLSLPSKKKLFFSLCHNPILIHGESKSFWLDKWSGKKCYMLAARDLGIAWGGTPRYWSWINLPDSRFKDVAALEFVWWLEIRGKINTSLLSPATVYTAYLVFKLRANAYGLGSCPTEVSVGVLGSTMNESSVCLVPQNGPPTRERRLTRRRLDDNHMHRLKQPRRRNDGWLEIELGEYLNGAAEGEVEVLEMSIREVKACKAGLVVEGIEIRPKAR